MTQSPCVHSGYSSAQWLRLLSNDRLFRSGHFPFAFFAGFSPGSFARMCSIPSIIPRMASGRVTGGSCFAGPRLRSRAQEPAGSRRRVFAGMKEMVVGVGAAGQMLGWRPRLKRP
jgi:hypothetical protein